MVSAFPARDYFFVSNGVAPEAFTAVIDSEDYISEENSIEPLKALVVPNKINKPLATLGRKLFNEKLLSGNNTFSCASCHNLKENGADKVRFSVGIHGQLASVNTPTVFNAALNFRQFWDGRAESLEDQVSGPVENPIEMDSNWNSVEQKLAQRNDYVSDFTSLFPDGIKAKNIRAAIAEFERTLITPRSPFDKYLQGDSKSMPPLALRGYQKFKDLGCTACHQGANVGGNMFQTFGVFVDLRSERKNITRADLGRYNITGDKEDEFKFKVPSLRNVALTAPYFHDGSAANLEDAVKTMAWYQLGRKLNATEIEELVAFLNSLTGEVPQ